MSLGINPDTLSALGLAPEDAAEMVKKLDDMDPGIPAGELWGRVSREVLSPDVPFPVHLHLYKSIFKRLGSLARSASRLDSHRA